MLYPLECSAVDQEWLRRQLGLRPGEIDQLPAETVAAYMALANEFAEAMHQ